MPSTKPVISDKRKQVAKGKRTTLSEVEFPPNEEVCDIQIMDIKAFKDLASNKYTSEAYEMDPNGLKDPRLRAWYVRMLERARLPLTKKQSEPVAWMAHNALTKLSIAKTLMGQLDECIAGWEEQMKKVEQIEQEKGPQVSSEQPPEEEK